MKSLRLLLLAFAAPPLVGACEDLPRDSEASEIVFAIEQRASEGKTVTTAGYELLTLGGRGSHPEGTSERGRSCWVEDLGTRLGQPRMESGEATFRAARLPPQGLVVRANAPEPATFEGAAWASGESIVFDAHGFAMPDVGPYEIRAASTELATLSPDGAAALALRSDADFTMTWQGSGAPNPEAVLVSLEVKADGEAGREVRCFFDREAGTGIVPHELVAALPDTNAARLGTLRVATHRQLSVIAPYNWRVYVVVAAVQRVQPFTLSR